MEQNQDLGYDSGTLHTSEVVSVRGSVVDIHFSHQLPPIYSLLRAGGA